jgi:hypothetical protein
MRQAIKPVDILETKHMNRSDEPNESTERPNGSGEPTGNTERAYRSNEPSDNTDQANRTLEPKNRILKANASTERSDRSPKPLARTVKPNVSSERKKRSDMTNASSERTKRTVFDELEEGASEETKRLTERYSFEIYTDQKESIEEVQYLYKKKTGKKLSASRIIREALEEYLTRAMEAFRQEE